MGTNGRKYPRPKAAAMAEAELGQEIQDCMRCRFFHNSRQCIARECIKTEGKRQAEMEAAKSQCVGCPYRQSDRYCFPCMRELLGRAEETAGGSCPGGRIAT